MNTHRAYMGADNTIACWVRDEAGRRDLTAATLTVDVFAYGVTVPLDTLEAVQATAVSPVTFEVTEAFSDASLAPGLYRFMVKADDVAVHHGLLEIV